MTVPAAWLPKADMKRIILHWTGGSYTVNALDRLHYHFIIDGDAKVHRGVHSVKANERIRGPYAAHVRGINTGSIGIAMAAMAGAKELPFDAGKFPLKGKQFDRAIDLMAQLCETYGIHVGPKTVLTHAEVQQNLGIPQAQKWDVTRLPWTDRVIGARAVGDHIRFYIALLLQKPES